MIRATQHVVSCLMLSSLCLVATPLAAQTHLVLDTNPGIAGGSTNSIATLGELAIFASIDPTGTRLYASDGSTAGTTVITVLASVPLFTMPTEFTTVGSRVLFAWGDGTGLELWATDGTAAGTGLVKDIRPGPFGSNPRDLGVIDGVLYFSAAEAGANYELWRSDGTTAGTWLVKDIHTTIGTGSTPAGYAKLGSTSSFLFAACQTARLPEPTARSTFELEQRVRMMEQFQQSLTPWMAHLSDNASPLAIEPPALTELVARLAALTDKLDVVADKAVVDASATTQVTPTTAAAVDVLRRALVVEQQRRALILANLANVSTCGFKRLVLDTETQRDEATGHPFPVVVRRAPVWTTGTLEITERSLDVAIDGAGLFVVRLIDGICGYTRNGCLQCNAAGQLVTCGGAVLQPEITIPCDALELAVEPEGRIMCRTASDPDRSRELGQLRLARFRNSSALEVGRDGKWVATTASGPAVIGHPGESGFGQLKQGFLESSNVQVLNEIVNLQTVDRQIVVRHRALASQGIYVR